MNTINLRMLLNLVQLKDGTCEGKTLTALPSASILHRLVSFVATKCEHNKFANVVEFGAAEGWHL